jgi:hypothetical protein
VLQGCGRYVAPNPNQPASTIRGEAQDVAPPFRGYVEVS